MSKVTQDAGSARTIYQVRLYVAVRWATGRTMRTGVRVVEIEEASTIIGGMRAIDKAIDLVGEENVLTELASPQITPNPAALGWPLDDEEEAR